MNSRTERALLDQQHHQIIADEYEAVVNQPRDIANAALFRSVTPHLPKQRAAMLDLGCGTGQMTRRFGHTFAAVTAVDHSAAMLAVAKQLLAPALQPKTKWIERDAFDFLAINTARFDLIAAVGFLHHLAPAALDQMLTMLASALAPGGRLLIAEPLEFDERDEPMLARRWNQAFRARFQGYTKHAPDPDEGPIALAHLYAALVRADLRVVYHRRAWELFPRFGRFWDRLFIPILDLFTRKRGVVGLFVVCRSS